MENLKMSHATETFKSLTTISTTIFKYLFLLNGGAAVALISGIDKLANILPPWAIRGAMLSFIFGLAAAGLATFFSYFTQLFLHQENTQNKTKGSHAVMLHRSIFSSAASLAAFCVGSLIAVFSMW